MATQNYFSHVSLDSRTFDVRIHNAGFSRGYTSRENIAAGQSTPAAVMDSWMKSPGHKTS